MVSNKVASMTCYLGKTAHSQPCTGESFSSLPRISASSQFCFCVGGETRIGTTNTHLIDIVLGTFP